MPAGKKKSAALRCSAPQVTSVCREEEEQLAKAIQASKAAAQEEKANRASLNYALEKSQNEHEEADSLRRAMQASLLSEQERLFAIGLGLQSTTHLVNITSSSPGKGSEIAGLTACVTDFCEQTKHLLKVSFRSDLHRVHVQWRSNAPVGDVFASLRSAVEGAFGFTTDPAYVLKYYDNDGEFCTLVEDTTLDFLDIFAERSSLRIFVDALIAPQDLGGGVRAEHAKTILAVGGTDQSMDARESFLIGTPPQTPRMLMAGAHDDDDEETSWALVDSSS